MSKAYSGQAEAVSMARSAGFKTDFVAQVRASFRKQGMMKLLGARITRVEKGLVEISARNRPEISQQDGFVHAGAIASLADSAGGYAALSLLPPDSRVLSVEFKINFTAPAMGKIVRGRGQSEEARPDNSGLRDRIGIDATWQMAILRMGLPNSILHQGADGPANRPSHLS